ncbi:MAG TPA: cation diffusion facilitator family transporter [Polyangiaceae bacterium]|nr:cation diffusion facilitator family transporter [Polyangiaceae bacterium]
MPHSDTPGHGHGGHGHGHGGHGHGGHAHGGRGSARTQLGIALGLTLSFMGVEAVVGWMSGSLALLADAGHMLGDGGALVLALVAQHVADRPRTELRTYGMKRAEVLAAFVNGIVLFGISLMIVREAVERFMAPVEIHARPMLFTAVVGLIVNLLSAAILMRGGKGNLNVRTAFLHVLSDLLGSVAAIVAGIGALWFGAQRLDPALSLLIAALTLVGGYRVLRETTSILLESAPPHIDVAAVERAIRETPGVASLHDLHVWRISEELDALTAHVTLARGAHGTEVCRSVADRLKGEFKLEHVTIQPEAPPPDELVAVRSSKDGAPIRRVS